jgi:hypothetical protein
VRLADAAALAALVCFLFYVGVETYVVRGVDFGVYYAAGRTVLAGGNPYDYRLVSQVLVDVTGEMNNPYYYPPWFCLAMAPLTLLPYDVARLIWIALLLSFYCVGAVLAFQVLRLEQRGWKRWLIILSGGYLLVWSCVRSEQLGTFLFLMLVLSLWGYQHKRPWLAGVPLVFLLTKPHVAWLVVPFLGWFYFGHQRQAVVWALALLVGLVLISTALLPGWYTRLTEPYILTGLGNVLDGSEQAVSRRLNTVLRDWLGQWGIAGALYWTILGGLVIGSGLVLWLAWRRKSGLAYMTALTTTVGLLLTPYALQYDYALLVLALFWVYRSLSRARPQLWWIALLILAAIFSVPIWEHPVYDGYWIVLGIALLLVLLNGSLWRAYDLAPKLWKGSGEYRR